MKKILLVILLFFINPAFCTTLKGGTSYDVPLKGFFGTWHVTSKIETTTNRKMFNETSVDIWNLSGTNSVLLLENGLSGAKSSIQINEKYDNLDGKKLKFKRVREYKIGNFKYIHTEEPEFVLNGNIFQGHDTYKVEKFDLNNNLISVDVVKYKVVGQKIAGE